MTQHSIPDNKCIQLIVIILTDIFKSNNKNELNISLIINFCCGSTHIKEETKFVSNLSNSYLKSRITNFVKLKKVSNNSSINEY